MSDLTGPAQPTFLMDANWRIAPSMSSDFETQIDKDVDATEQRRGLRSKPRRTTKHSGMTLNKLHGARFLIQSAEQTGTLTYQPLMQDETILTADAITGTGVLACDTDDRRFFAGHDILIVEWSVTKMANRVERHTITQVLDGSLDIDGTIGTTFNAGASVYPCIIANANLQQAGNVVNDEVFEFNISFTERADASTLPALVAPGTNPPGATVFKGLPVLDIPHHWQTTSEGVVRKGQSKEVGLDTIFALHGDISPYTAQLAFQQHSRSEAFDLLRFFESRGGSTFSFWYPLRSTALELISKTAINITVSASIPLSKLTGDNKILAIWLKDGSVLMRIVVGGFSTGATYILTLNETTSPTMDQIEKISFGTLARFATDSLNERWQNTKVMETNLPIQGLLFSDDVSCTSDCCEKGNCSCDPGDCDDPPPPPDDPDPPGGPWEPEDVCLSGTADVPTYFDLHETWSSGREPIRAADLNLPDSVVVQIKSTLVVDSNHPDAPVDISPELKAVLFRSHELLYAGELTRTVEKSRNPYHYRVDGDPAGYGHRAGGEEIEDSPYWEAIIDYMVGMTAHTLTVRGYAEWVDQGSGIGDTEFGAWGTMFVWWAWSSEHDTYVDGTPFAPFDNTSFTKTDPFVGAHYESLFTADKYAHPSALFMAMSPTSWHNPIGYDFHSKLDRDQFLHECFAENPGAPWSNGSAADANDNAVFGQRTGSLRPRRALGAFGGWTKSEFFNWVCIENAAGTGMTILKPTRPGWVEATAVLTPGSADIIIDVCTPDQSSNAINGCDGHPDNPCQGVGGTHDCWRDNSIVGTATSWICLQIGAKTTVRVKEKCITITTKFDEDCVVEDETCFDSTLTTTFSAVEVEDYRYNFGGSQAGRFIDFRQYEDDPDYVRQHWPQIECDTPGTYWVNLVGSGAETVSGCPGTPSAISALTPTSGKTINLLWAYKNPTAPLDTPEDGEIFFKVTPENTDQIGFSFRSAEGGGDMDQGYLGIVNMVDGKLQLYVVTSADTISLLAETTIVGGITPDEEIEITGTMKGHTLTLKAVGGTVTAIDCTYQTGGLPGLVALSEDTFSVQDLTITDDNWKKREVSGDINSTASIMSAADFKLCKGYTQGILLNTCNSCSPDSCPGDEPFGGDCNGPCSVICKYMQGVYSVASSGYPSGTTQPHNTPWHPPTDVGPCDDPPCQQGATPCVTCPGPYGAYSWNFGGDCGDSQNPADNLSIWIGGLTAWSWITINCI